jgi:replicative DNA helicase Mcm
METSSQTTTDKTKTSVAKFEEFFSSKYKDTVFEALEKYPEQRSIIVDYNELEMFDPDLADLIIEKPEEVIRAAQKAVQNIDPLRKNAELNIRFQNLRNKIPLRYLRSKFIGKFVAVDGIVRKTDEIRPRIVKAMFECRSCMRLHEVQQKTNIVNEPALCQECGGRSFRILQEESEFMDTQTCKLQEPLENLSGGEQPRQIILVFEDDMVDSVTPGDIVRITGTLKTVRDEKTKRFKNYIYGNYIEALEQEFEELKISPEDEELIKELSQDKNVYDKIIRSTAPSIQGYREVKEAIALQLFGGHAKELEDKTRIRGDIHILIVGDPGIGKSQILKYVSKLAPRGIYTSGKGTSGVGLTAAAVRDEFGGWSLEAGALVLGDRGNVCVDELDKMRDEDRSAIHEALEQQSYHKDFELLLSNGNKIKIGDYVDNQMKKYEKEIIQGKNSQMLPNHDLSVMAYDLDGLKIIPTKIDRISRHKAPNKFVKIELSNGRQVQVTPEHPTLIWNNGIRAVQADQVKIDDFILGINEYKTIETENLDIDSSKFLGFILSEGHTYKNEKNGQYEVGFSNTDENLISEFKEILKRKKINYIISVREKPGWKTLYTVRINSKKFYGELKRDYPEVFLRSPHSRPSRVKRVPQKILNSANEMKKSFLNAYFKGDGFIDNYRAAYSTSSIKMAEDLQDLLLMLNIYNYIHTEVNKEGTYYKVVISGKNNMIRFREIIADDHRVDRLHKLIETSKNRKNDRDVLPIEIVAEMDHVLKDLKLSDGKLVNNLKRGQNAHRKTLKRYFSLIEEKLKDVKLGIKNRNLDDAKRIYTISDLSRKLSIPLSTLRYQLKNDETGKLNIFFNEAEKKLDETQKHFENVKKQVNNNVRYLRVKNVETIENTDSEWVYDITVEPYHLFVSHGMVLHNTISIAKAGIMATLNSRCSVLAAANPKFGRFDRYKSIADQIELPSTILSRFDLIFVVEDKPDAERDKELAAHILRIHQDNSIPFEIDPELLRKYIAFARREVKPHLTDDAMEVLQEFYVGMRSGAVEEDSPVPITARQLEALVRLSEASARIRLSHEVEAIDAKRAITLQMNCLKQVGYDPETGKLDIDKVEGRTPQSEREKFRIVSEVIRELADEYGGQAPSNIIIKELEDRYNIVKEKTEEIIRTLKRQGMIYEPRTGYYKIA